MYSLYEIYWYIEWKKVKSSCSSPLFRHDVLSTISLEVCRGSLDAPQDTAAANLPKIESCSWTCNFLRAQVKHRSQVFFFLEISDFERKNFQTSQAFHSIFISLCFPIRGRWFSSRRFLVLIILSRPALRDCDTNIQTRQTNTNQYKPDIVLESQETQESIFQRFLAGFWSVVFYGILVFGKVRGKIAFGARHRYRCAVGTLAPGARLHFDIFVY